MHSPEFDELVLLGDAGELDPAAAARLAVHEPGCPACRNLRAALAAGRAAAAAAAVSLPGARLDRLAAAARGAAPAPRPRRGVLPRLLAASALAAAVLLVTRASRGPDEGGGLERDLARLQSRLAAAEASWTLEDPFSDLDADIRRLEEWSARLRREVEGT